MAVAALTPYLAAFRRRSRASRESRGLRPGVDDVVPHTAPNA